MKTRIVTVVGGSGFIGRHIVKALCKAGYTVRVLCRDTIAAAHLKTAGNVGQVVLQHADITDEASLSGKFAESFAVINLVSCLYSRGTQNFEALNVKGAAAVARAAKEAGAERLIHFSALGAENATNTRYGRTKKQGEDAVRHAFREATIFRPSLVFGIGDEFFNRFARMSLVSPVLPLIRGGKTQFQPVYAEDIARAALNALANDAAKGESYALAGPHCFSLKTMLEMMMRQTRRKRVLASIPTALASTMGLISELLPFPPAITRDQVKLLAHDNVAKPGERGLETLGVEATALEPILPAILERYAA